METLTSRKDFCLVFLWKLNKFLEEKSLSLFSFQQWQPLAFELAFLEKLTTLRLITTKPAKHS